MGTFVEVISPDKKAAEAVFAEIKRIENLLSKYIPESEVSRLNRYGKLKVSPETYYVLKKSQEFWLASDGAFDITVGPLLDLWGFTEKQYRLPEDGQIKSTLAVVGFDKIIFHDSDNVIEFSIPAMKVDLGGIAKGFAVDCAVKKLKEAGIKSCLINAGGQIYCLGDNLGSPWDIAVKDPRGAGITQSLKLKNKAVSTSGDYEQYFINANKRYAHIFNPKTGYPVNSQLVSVTVVADDGLTADALSTSTLALGKIKGKELADKFPDIKVIMIEKKDR
jgi:thiamine biosynthesis lipoprotein